MLPELKPLTRGLASAPGGGLIKCRHADDLRPDAKLVHEYRPHPRPRRRDVGENWRATQPVILAHAVPKQNDKRVRVEGVLSGINESARVGGVSTIAEIESAIERLPADKVREIAAWLEEYQATINASAEVFALLDEEEGKGDQWHERK